VFMSKVESKKDVKGIIASKSPTDKSPILETQEGEVIVSSEAISRFLANLRRDACMMGSGSLRDSLAVDDWVNWAAQELEIAVCVSYYMATECMPFNKKIFTKAKKDIACALGILETHLREESSTDGILARIYLVIPNQVTLADVFVACELFYPLTLVLDEGDLKLFPAVMRWFRNCMQQPEFISVLGRVEYGKK